MLSYLAFQFLFRFSVFFGVIVGSFGALPESIRGLSGSLEIILLVLLGLTNKNQKRSEQVLGSFRDQKSLLPLIGSFNWIVGRP